MSQVPQQNNTPEYITRKQLAERLQLDYTTTARYSREGYFPVIRIGGSIRYNWTEIQNKILKASNSYK